MPNIILNNERLIIFMTFTLGSIFGHVSKLVGEKKNRSILQSLFI